MGRISASFFCCMTALFFTLSWDLSCFVFLCLFMCQKQQQDKMPNKKEHDSDKKSGKGECSFGQQ